MALAADTSIRRYGAGGYPNQMHAPVKAATKIYKGGLVVLDAGYAAPGRAATGLVPFGVAYDTVDNSSGAAGDKRVVCDLGIFPFKNSASADLIAQSDAGALCYIVDDETVAKTNGSSTRSIAGRIANVDADGTVWVFVSMVVN